MSQPHDANSHPCMCDSCILARWAANPPSGAVELAMREQSQVRMLERMAEL